MIEIASPQWGMGELQLLMPLMRSVVAEGKWILWLSPPYLLYAPALLQAGIDTDQLLVMDLHTSCNEALWSMEKALQTESCGLVLAWQNWLSDQVVRRLQLAAEQGGTLGVLFQRKPSRNLHSALSLRIEGDGGLRARAHHPGDGGIGVTVLRARGCFRPLSARIMPAQQGVVGEAGPLR